MRICFRIWNRICTSVNFEIKQKVFSSICKIFFEFFIFFASLWSIRNLVCEFSVFLSRFSCCRRCIAERLQVCKINDRSFSVLPKKRINIVFAVHLNKSRYFFLKKSIADSFCLMRIALESFELILARFCHAEIFCNERRNISNDIRKSSKTIIGAKKLSKTVYLSSFLLKFETCLLVYVLKNFLVHSCDDHHLFSLRKIYEFRRDRFNLSYKRTCSAVFTHLQKFCIVVPCFFSTVVYCRSFRISWLLSYSRRSVICFFYRCGWSCFRKTQFSLEIVYFSFREIEFLCSRETRFIVCSLCGVFLDI